ncbi:CD209 antigen-like protein C isoform X1 [Ambystoma mexicanum]|uniref:CD209 antigen-like protein C isoform X1 n=1 Tax=Ambystoma mexicanum TaxID=8296 RepID=UPI0037E93B8D
MERDSATQDEEAVWGTQSQFRRTPAAAGFSLLDAPRRKDCGSIGATPFNLLLLGAFIISLILFSVTLAKYSELSAELKKGPSCAFNISQDLMSAMIKGSEELKKISDFMCMQCPTGWLAFNNTCYFFSRSSVTYDSAKQSCAVQNSRVVILNNKEEVNFLIQHTGSKGYWISLTDIDTEGKWHWGDGTPLTFSNWNKGEPNNDKNNEDCVEMRPDGFWNDLPCSTKFNFICEATLSC